MTNQNPSVYLNENMSERESRSRLIGGATDNREGGTTIYSDDERENPSLKYCQLSLLAISVIVVLVVLIISLAESAKYSRGMYVFLGLNLLGFLLLNFILMVFVHKGELDSSRKWFIPATEGCIIVESIFTAIAILS